MCFPTNIWLENTYKFLLQRNMLIKLIKKLSVNNRILYCKQTKTVLR